MEPNKLTYAEQFALLMQAMEALDTFSYATGVDEATTRAVAKAHDALSKQAREVAYYMAVDKFQDVQNKVRDTYHDQLRAAVRKAG